MRSSNWLRFALVTACTASLYVFAQAATYNIYFNNPEQGPNSTANPTVTVTQAGAPPSATNPSPDASSAGPTQTQNGGPKSSEQAGLDSNTGQSESRWTLTGTYSAELWQEDMGSSSSLSVRSQTYSISAAYRFHRTLSVSIDAMLRTQNWTFRDAVYNANGGPVTTTYASSSGKQKSFNLGLSVEWLPIVGLVGSHRLIELGPLAQLVYDFGIDDGYAGTYAAAGARFVLNLSSSVGLVGSYRHTIPMSNGYSTGLVDAGLRFAL